MDFAILSPGKWTIVVFQANDRFSIVGAENISAISYGE
jgi:hypothetical protein